MGTPSIKNSTAESVGFIDIDFSRHFYRPGGTLVALIRCLKPVDELSLVVFGRTRLDKRWHSSDDRNAFGRHPSIHDFPEQDLWHWGTERLDLLDLEERGSGSWEDVRPDRPIQIFGHDIPDRQMEPINLEYCHFKAFSLRVDLPLHLPPTSASASCRYSYSVLVRFKVDGKVDWVEEPFLLKSTFNSHQHAPSTFGYELENSLRVVAHSAGLPAYVSVTDLHQLPGRVTVRLPHTGTVRTLNIKSPSGRSVCYLSTIGVTSSSPGRHMHLQFDFSESGDSAPCHQICACLQGQEVAIHRNGTRNRAKTFLLDTAYRRVDPECIEQISLDFFVPHDTPCTLSSPVLDVSFECIVDLTILEGRDYQNLHIEIPCLIRDELASFENTEPDEMMEATINYERKLHGVHVSFPTLDILDDLRTLSLSMAKKCGLTP